MKLNYDCFREVFLFIEEKLIWEDDLKYHYLQLYAFEQNITKYSKAEIAYALKMGIEAGLIDGVILDSDAGIFDIRCFGLTFEGHQFLDTVRENKIWQKTKSALKAVSGASLSVITSIAKDFLIDYLKTL